MRIEIHSPKYELTPETRRYAGIVLYRIRALRDFVDVRAGDLGGWAVDLICISHMGDDWVYGDEMAFKRCRVLRGKYKLHDENEE